jgi:hypothetical protein
MRNAKAPTLGQVIELRERAPESLESAAASINRHIDLFTRSAGAYQAHRVRAGFELIAVRKRIPHGERENWCADNIHRSMGDIRKLMALAGADDPHAAVEEERSATRERMRANRAHVRAVGINTLHIEPAQAPGRSHPTVKHVFQLFLQLDKEQRIDFLALVEEEMEP